MKNEADWLELFELAVFNDADDPRHEQAWKWAQELQSGGRLTGRDVFALQCLCDTLSTLPQEQRQEAAIEGEDKNRRLERAVISGILPDLLNDEEKDALLDFIKHLRSTPKAAGEDQ